MRDSAAYAADLQAGRLGHGAYAKLDLEGPKMEGFSVGKWWKKYLFFIFSKK